MTTSTSENGRHFSAFTSAADEVSSTKSQQHVEPDRGETLAGRVVSTPGRDQPYKVVLEHASGGDTDHPFTTVRDAEAFVRLVMPTVPERDTRRDTTPNQM